MTKLIVFGAAGRMGSKILELAQGNAALEIAGAVESKNHPAVDKKILDGKYSVVWNLEALQDKADVAIDFTVPAATMAHLEILSGWRKTAIVIGTTGFSDKEKAQIQEFAKKIPIVFSPNMSRGANLLFKLARLAASKLPDYDIEIVEAHHNQKKDAPSGTALALAKEIADELLRNEKTDFIYGREGIVGARSKEEIGIHAVRAGDIVGDHTVYFALGGERVEITHRAASRDAFAHGAIHAAQWVAGKKPGLYTMQDVLEK